MNAADTSLADRVRDSRRLLVDAAVEEMYRRHPEWVARWGSHGREMTERDTAYHLEFLEASLRAGKNDIFARYAAWLAGLLRARDVPLEALTESFEILETLLQRDVDKNEAARLGASFDEARRAARSSTFVPGERAPKPHPASALLEQALVEADKRRVERIIADLLASGVSHAELGDSVVQPAMAAIGRRWQHNQLTVAQEHLATAILQTALARTFTQAELKDLHGRRALLACVEGNQHALGLRIVADTMEMGGWDVRFLGADVPTRDLLLHVQSWRPHVLALSLSLPRHVAVARAVVEAVRTQAARDGQDAPRIISGGLPLNDFEGLASLVGADEWHVGADSLRRGLA